MEKLYEIQFSVSINKVLLECAMPICLHIVYGCFHATASELSSSDRAVAHKVQYYFLALYRILLPPSLGEYLKSATKWWVFTGYFLASSLVIITIIVIHNKYT